MTTLNTAHSSTGKIGPLVPGVLDTNGVAAPAVVPAFVPVNSSGTELATTGNPLTVTDTNSAAFQGEVAMTVGTTYTAQRSLKVICTAAGNVSVTYADGSTGVWAVQVGVQTFPISVTTVNSSGTTATATYANLK